MARNKTLKAVTVEYLGCSIQKKVVSLTVKVARSDLDFDQADGLLIDAQLTVELIGDPQGRRDTDGQQRLTDTDISCNGVADVHSVTVAKRTMTFRLSFNRDDAPIDELQQIAYSKGRLSAVRTGNAGPAEKDDAE